jgi:protease-4
MKIWSVLFFILFESCIAFNQVKFLDLPEKSLDFNEYVLYGTDRDKILLLSVEGVITESSPSGPFGIGVEDSMVARVKEELNKASLDPLIKGIVLKVNSPGGGVTASDILYRELMEYKRKTNNPIVAIFMDTAASGGYYISMAADSIVAHPTSVTGSIGVIVSGLNVKEGLEKIGIKDQTFVSGNNKNLLSPFAEMTPEKKKIIQSIVDNLYERFYRIVKKNRFNLQDSKLRQLADGRIFTAEQALAEGLIDKIGYTEDAIKTLMELPNYRKSLGNENPRIVVYALSRKPVKNFYQTQAIPESFIDSVSKKLNLHSSIKFLYLWQ